MNDASTALPERVLAGFLAPDTEPHELAQLRLQAAVEQARSEIRYGNLEAGARLLSDVADRIGAAPDAETRGLLAVAYSVWGQGLQAWGNQAAAARYCLDAVREFVEVCGPGLSEEAVSQHIGTRAISDLGMALAGVGQHEQAEHALRAGRRLGGSTPEATRHLAGYATAHGDLAEAEELLDEVLPILPTDAEAWYTLAQIRERAADGTAAGGEVVSLYRHAAALWLHREAFDQALPALEHLAELRADDPAVLTALAEALRNTGQLAAAEPVADRAVTAAPGTLEPWLGRALLRRQLGRLAEALADAGHALQIDPAEPAALLIRGYVHLDRGELDQSLADAEAALALDPGFVLAQAHKARVLIAQDRLAEAREPLLGAHVARPQDQELTVEYARLAARLDDPIAVIEALAPIWQEPTVEPGDVVLLVDALVKQHALDDAGHVARTRHQAAPDDQTLRRLLASVLANQAYEHPFDADYLQAVADEAMKLAPDQPDVLVLRGMAAWSRQQPAEAEELFTAALKVVPQHTTALEQLAVLLAEQGRWAEVEPVARQGLIASGRARFQLHLAMSLQQRGREREALALLGDEPPDIGDDRALWLTARAECAEALDRWGEAQRDRAELIDLTPEDGLPDAWFALAEAARMAGDWEPAVQASRKAIELKPDHLLARGTLGAALAMGGQKQAARAEFDEALRLDSAYQFGLTERARLAGSLEEMRIFLARLAETEPDPAYLHLARAGVLLDHGRYAEALGDFEAVLASTPHDVLALIDAANCHSALDQLDEAIELASRAVDLQPDSSQALLTLAAAKNRRGLQHEALGYLQQAQEIVPDDVNVVGQLTETLRILDRVEESLSVIDHLVQRRPRDPGAWATLGNLLADLGYFDEAQGPLRSALSLDAENPWVRNNLGWALEHAEEPDLPAALDCYEEAVQLMPERRELMKSLADARHLLGRPGAEELYREIIEWAAAEPGSSMERAWLVAWCLFRLRDLDRAGRRMFAALALPAEGDAARMDLGLIELCRERDEAALQHYRGSVSHISKWDARRRRGPLRVAQLDLEVACRDWPSLAERPAARQIRELLASSQENLPPLPDLESLHRVSGNTTTPNGRE